MSITLCAIDTIHHELAKFALNHSSKQMKFDKIIFITDKDCNIPSHWEWHKIPTIKDLSEYSRIVLKELNDHIDTDYVLLIQYDGFIANGKNWSQDFLKYDYIGAPWTFHDIYQVGNGGFSLRSKKLLEVCLDENVKLLGGSNKNELLEDATICRYFRSYLEVMHKIKFAPLNVAEDFAYENGTKVSNKLFGFHGFHLLHNFYQNENFDILINNLQPYVFKKIGILDLAIQYFGIKCYKESGALVKKFIENNNIEITQQFFLKRCGGNKEQFNNFWSLIFIK